MSARDDYPALTKWAGYRAAQQDAERALDEIDRLRAQVASMESQPPAALEVRRGGQSTAVTVRPPTTEGDEG